jgi:hypothetical protein
MHELNVTFADLRMLIGGEFVRLRKSQILSQYIGYLL